MSAKIKNTPDYGTPQAVLQAIDLMQEPEKIRAKNRAKINSLMNGELPLTPEEVKENQASINVNWGEGGKAVREANGQVNNSLLHKGNFANYRLLKGKVEKRDEWSAAVTADVNRIKSRGKSGKKNYFRLKNRNASLTLHGIGVLLWADDYKWMARFTPLEDLLIPTGTLQDFSNLTHFAVNLYLTPYELMTMTHGDPKVAAEKGWNLAAVRQVLSTYGKLNENPDGYHWDDRPEHMVDLWKENHAACNLDSVPKVNLACLYYKSPEGGDEQKENWYRKIVLKDVQQGEGVTGLKIDDKFIFDSGKRVFAEDIDHILHVQYGDVNVVAPNTYHGTRGLGELIFAVVQYLNRLRCQWFHHVMERMMMGLKISNPTDRDRPKIFNLKPYFVLEDGISIIPESERHQVDPRLVEGAMSESRQLLSESSASYVQDIDNGTNREQTLGEAQIKLQNANKIVSTMMDTLYKLETFKEEEEFRRLMLPNTSDPDAKRFQEQWKKHNIPTELMKPECWQVDIERVAGNGDKTLALQENMLMLNNSQRFDPTAQRTILRDFTAVVKDDWAKAKALVPDEPPKVTAGRKAAEDVFGTLMSGAPVGLREGIEQMDYVAAMMEMMNAVMERIEGTDQMGTPQDVIGLNTVANDIQQHLDLMEQNPENKEFVTEVGKALGKGMNDVKAYAQRQAEKAQAGQQDPEAMAKAQATEAAAAQKLQINEANFLQKQQQAEEKFAQKMRQAEEQQVFSIKQMLDEARLEIESLRAKTLAELAAMAAKTSAEVAAMEKKADAAPKPAAKQT